MGRNRSSNNKGEEELHAAARSGDLRAVQAIVATNPRALNSRDKHSRTPLHLAAWSGHTEVVKYLCQQKADVGAAAMDDMGAIHFAAQKGHLEIVRTLLSNGVSIKSTNRKGFTPFHYATQGSHLELVMYLAKKGSNLNAETKAGKTPLDLASSEEIRSFLVEWEKSPNKEEVLNAEDKAEGSAANKTEIYNEEVLNAEDKAEGSEAKKSEVSEEVDRGKRKGGEEEPKEASMVTKKVKVVLSHLMGEDETQDDEE